MASESSFLVFCDALVSVSAYLGSHYSGHGGRTIASVSLGETGSGDAAGSTAAPEPRDDPVAQVDTSLAAHDMRICNSYLGVGISVILERRGGTGGPSQEGEVVSDRTGQDPDLDVLMVYMLRQADSHPMPVEPDAAKAWVHRLIDDSFSFCMTYFEQKRPADPR